MTDAEIIEKRLVLKRMGLGDEEVALALNSEGFKLDPNQVIDFVSSHYGDSVKKETNDMVIKNLHQLQDWKMLDWGAKDKFGNQMWSFFILASHDDQHFFDLLMRGLNEGSCDWINDRNGDGSTALLNAIIFSTQENNNAYHLTKRLLQLGADPGVVSGMKKCSENDEKPLTKARGEGFGPFDWVAHIVSCHQSPKNHQRMQDYLGAMTRLLFDYGAMWPTAMILEDGPGSNAEASSNDQKFKCPPCWLNANMVAIKQQHEEKTRLTSLAAAAKQNNPTQDNSTSINPRPKKLRIH